MMPKSPVLQRPAGARASFLRATPRPATLPAIAAIALLLLAGCTGQPGLFDPQSEKAVRYGGTLHFAAPFATDGSGNHTAMPSWAKDPASFPLAVEQLTGLAGAEPNIGVTSDGALFVTTFDNLQRSKDQGRTWEKVWTYVTPGYPTTEDILSTADPMLWVDPDTDRVYVQHMVSTQCTWMAFSDSLGDPGTFVERPMMCEIPLIDHMKIMTAHYGPGMPKPENPLYPNVFYMCSNKLDLGTWCATSFDGGLTFDFAGPVHSQDVLCANINGHPVAWPDGTMGVPLGVGWGANCERPPTVYVTETNGIGIPSNPVTGPATGWAARACAPDFRQVEIDPDLTTTPDGTSYMLFRHEDQLHYLMRSTDKFVTCDVFKVNPPEITVGVFAAITSGDDGKVALAWLGTTDEQDDDYGVGPSFARGGTVWHAYVTTILDAAAEDPTFVHQRVTPDEDPVQIGCVWLQGGGGGPHGCRNMLDFIDMVTDREGRVFVAITDGCTPRNGCAGDTESIGYQSRDAQVAILAQDHGVSLIGDKLLPALGLEHPQPFPE